MDLPQTAEELKRLIAANRFLQHNHIRLEVLEEDYVVMALTLTEDSLNAYGYAHGGVLYTIADSATGIAARTNGHRYVTLSSSFNFLHSGLLGDTIRAEGRVRRRGKTTCYAEVDVTNQDGQLLASGNFVFYQVD